MPLAFFGLDGEMSGDDLAAGHKLIQIGVAAALDDIFVSYIGWDAPECPMDPEASSVHRIPLSTITAAPRAAAVDDRLHDWLMRHGANEPPGTNAVAVGYSVDHIDVPFLTSTLPRSARLFRGMTLELNALLLAMAKAGLSRDGRGEPARLGGWKRMAEQEATRAMKRAGVPGRRHDAGFDAAFHLAVFDWLVSQLRHAAPDEDRPSGYSPPGRRSRGLH